MTKQQKTTNFVFAIALLVGLVGAAYFAWKPQEDKKQNPNPPTQPAKPTSQGINS